MKAVLARRYTGFFLAEWVVLLLQTLRGNVARSGHSRSWQGPTVAVRGTGAANMGWQRLWQVPPIRLQFDKEQRCDRERVEGWWPSGRT